MSEVVSRRFARLRDVADEEYDESFSAVPNLVVIDGGKGQLSAALGAMQAFDLPRVAVIALAKRDEEVYVPDRSEPILLSRHAPGLQLLQRIRDEAHRFAITYHRTPTRQRTTRLSNCFTPDLPPVTAAMMIAASAGPKRPGMPRSGENLRSG
jgi:excinuclease ABC subunit C